MNTTLMAPIISHPNLAYIDDADLTGISQGYREAYFAKYGNRYLYPNDSRMYKLKLVLWEILNGPGLVSGLRMAGHVLSGKDMNLHKFQVLVCITDGYLQKMDHDRRLWRAKQQLGQGIA